MKRFFLLITFLGLALYGCADDSSKLDGPPEGWEGGTTRWWLAGSDTTNFFRDLESLESMGVMGSDLVYLSQGTVGSEKEVRAQFKKAVKQSLIRVYRNEPAIVDSLFETYLTPRIEKVTFTSDPGGDVEKFKQESYKFLRLYHFRAPITKLKLGTDVPVIYPDSLRMQDISGEVKLQVHLDTDGAPQSVELLEGVHPLLDLSAMEATTRMRWLPAYVEHDGDWKAIPSWARFRIKFSKQQEQAEAP